MTKMQLNSEFIAKLIACGGFARLLAAGASVQLSYDHDTHSARMAVHRGGDFSFIHEPTMEAVEAAIAAAPLRVNDYVFVALTPLERSFFRQVFSWNADHMMVNTGVIVERKHKQHTLRKLREADVAGKWMSLRQDVVKAFLSPETGLDDDVVIDTLRCVQAAVVAKIEAGV